MQTPRLLVKGVGVVGESGAGLVGTLWCFMREGGKESKGHVQDEKDGALSSLGGWSVLGMTLSDVLDPLSRPLEMWLQIILLRLCVCLLFCFVFKSRTAKSNMVVQ